VATTSNNRVRFDDVQHAFIAADAGFHDFCRFSFKIVPPKLANKTASSVLQKERFDGEAAFNEIVSFVQSRLTSWSEGVPINDETLQQTNRTIVKTIYGILIGTVKSDEDPEGLSSVLNPAESLGK
jgi:hypothetical protein